MAKEIGMATMIEKILQEAQQLVQSNGFNGFSFRDLARAVGIKSASIHYYFPTKGDLSAAVANRYTNRLLKELGSAADYVSPAAAMQRYVAIFRRTLEQDGRMCLVGILAAEVDTLPAQVLSEIQRFVEVNTVWISLALQEQDVIHVDQRAEAIFSALEGAMLVARGTRELGLFDRTVAAYVTTGLIPS